MLEQLQEHWREFRESKPGQRFKDRYRRRRRDEQSHILWRIFLITLGAIIALGSLVLAPLPGPGWGTVFVGLMILAGVIVSILLWANLANNYVWAVLFVGLGFGAIGFYDDYLKLTRRNHHGLSGRRKLLAQVLVAGLATVAVMQVSPPALASQSQAGVQSAVLKFRPTDSRTNPSNSHRRRAGLDARGNHRGN
jgi:hypothetical protein